MIAEKRNERYSDVVIFVRRKLRFALLKCLLVAIRGVRGKKKDAEVEAIQNISFNLIPEG